MIVIQNKNRKQMITDEAWIEWHKPTSIEQMAVMQLAGITTFSSNSQQLEKLQKNPNLVVEDEDLYKAAISSVSFMINVLSFFIDKIVGISAEFEDGSVQEFELVKEVVDVDDFTLTRCNKKQIEELFDNPDINVHMKEIFNEVLSGAKRTQEKKTSSASGKRTSATRKKKKG